MTIDIDEPLYKDHFKDVVSTIKEGKVLNFNAYSPERGESFEIVLHPFTVTGTGSPWSIMVGAPVNKIMADIRSMTFFSIMLAFASMTLTGLIIFFVASSITKPLIKVSQTLKDISEGEGDLTRQIIITSKDEIGELARYFNLTLEKIRNLVVIIKQQSVSLFNLGNELASNMTQTAAAVNQITSNIQSIKGRVINQSAGVTETNSTMEQITVNIDKLTERIENI
ncbi:MAG: methyl-accepting chemotaxis protein [Treponema sp.]|jgi:methyl-accepting chemotaxis protein|nr:methyl-accepting chemotaxis protein [Treponema sp.]